MDLQGAAGSRAPGGHLAAGAGDRHLKLLLDEHYAKSIAEQLREHGYDVLAVTERSDLRRMADDELLRFAASAGRALVTENVRDFVPLVRDAAVSHQGIVFTSPRSLPRHRGTIGRYVRLLRDLLDAHPGDEALQDRAIWLGAGDD